MRLFLFEKTNCSGEHYEAFQSNYHILKIYDLLLGQSSYLFIY